MSETSTFAALIIGSDEQARDATIASLEAQSIPVRVLRSGDSLRSVTESVVLLLGAGGRLSAHACEQMWWFLATHQDAGWVGGQLLEATDRRQSLEEAVSAVALRTVDLREQLDDPAWREISGEAAGASGAALRGMLTMHAVKRRGGCTGAIIETLPDTDDFLEDVARSRASLELLQLDEQVILSPAPEPPDRTPLQHVGPGLPSGLSMPTVRLPAARGRRVLALLQGFPAGGYTAFNVDLLTRLTARGHVVTTAMLEWWRSEWRLSRIRTVAPDLHHVPSIVPFGAMVAYLEHLITSRKIEVVFLSHSFVAYRLLPLLRAKFPSVAFCDYVHTEWFEESMYGSYAAMSATWSASLDAQIISSEALKAAIVRRTLGEADPHVVYVGVDTDFWDPVHVDRVAARQALGGSPSSLMLLFAGRLSEEKRPWIALQVLHRLRQDGVDARLFFAGQGPLTLALHQRAKAMGLEASTIFLGDLDEPTLREVYGGVDLLLLPSRIEGIARTLYEAMAMGCIPVVSDVGGQKELVTPGTGSLVPPLPESAEGYLRAVRGWLAQDRRFKAAAAARARMVTQFGLDDAVSGVERVLEQSRARRVHAPADLPIAYGEELAVLGLEIGRRHAVRIASKE